jgi:hypothetical protein
MGSIGKRFSEKESLVKSTFSNKDNQEIIYRPGKIINEKIGIFPHYFSQA